MARAMGSKRTYLRPADIEQYLAGLDFPATKREVIEYVRDGKPPRDVMSAVSGIDDRIYGGPTELNRVVAEMVDRSAAHI